MKYYSTLNKKEKFLLEEKLEEILNKRFGKSKENEQLKQILSKMIEKKSIPVELIEKIPKKPEEAGRTKFDQIYEAAIELAFPSYGKNTLSNLTKINDNKIKIWRIVAPNKYKIPHVLIRAESIQEAFALACDYVCRASLRLLGEIPADLQIRVIFMSEKAVRRYLGIKWANRLNKRKKLNLMEREFSNDEIQKATEVALNGPKDETYRIVKYMEEKDLLKIKKTFNRIRISPIEKKSTK